MSSDPQVVEDHSAEVLKYAAKFNYPQLANRAARWTLPKYSLEDMVKVFGAGNELTLLAWVSIPSTLVSLKLIPLFEGSLQGTVRRSHEEYPPGK